MLYVTTRDNKDAYTVHKTMVRDLAPDGGVFIPFQIPVLEKKDLSAFVNRTYGENIAEILNRFFSARLNGWSIDTAIGRNCIQTKILSQKISAVELWHNPAHSYDYVAENLFRLLSSSEEIAPRPTNWVLVAVKVAVLFAAYADLIKNGTMHEDEQFDVAVKVGDFTDPISVWYAKQMGLPVHMVLCASEESDGVWDLIHRGQVSTASIPKELASGLERLIFSIHRAEEAACFVQTCNSGRVYALDPETDIIFNDIFFCAVMGQGRAETVANSLKRTDQYAVCPDGALSYAAIQDYRAKTGENRMTLLFSNAELA